LPTRRHREGACRTQPEYEHHSKENEKVMKKSPIVTGVSQGIGRAVAKRLAKDEVSVVNYVSNAAEAEGAVAGRFNSRTFGTSRSLVIRRLPLTACFQDLASGEYIALPTYVSAPGWQLCRATGTDDPEDREISAAEIYGVYLKRAYGGRGGRGAEAAF
jgi:hypothetical protein